MTVINTVSRGCLVFSVILRKAFLLQSGMGARRMNSSYVVYTCRTVPVRRRAIDLLGSLTSPMRRQIRARCIPRHDIQDCW
jgi:hypothetical protein